MKESFLEIVWQYIKIISTMIKWVLIACAGVYGVIYLVLFVTTKILCQIC